MPGLTPFSTVKSLSAKPLSALLVMLAVAVPVSPSMAQEPTEVREVAISADLDAIGNPRAATYWAGLEDDLQGAILALLTDRIAEDGVKIEVKLSTVELASAFENIANLADTRMTGQVNITSRSDNSDFNAYELTVTIEEALPYLPPGTVINAISLENRDYYSAMVTAFARAVVDRL
ncbi:MAG: hypothetical protein CFE34_13900 [Rhodobacteraceae bacterium PARR1]|nr:MAG: hypothetical protein CFE34_13900 [Rhodobacteraceae bacterium PARR1]